MHAPPISAGSRAPAFTLRDQHGHSVSLDQLLAEKKPLFLIFYPGDMTPGCTLQLCAIRNEWKSFERAGVSVFGINHAPAESHTRFSDAYSLPFPLLVDERKKISAAYGCVKPVFKTTVINRTVVGINPDGKIFYYKRGIPKISDMLKAVGR